MVYKILIADDFVPDLEKMYSEITSFTTYQFEIVDKCENGMQTLDSICLYEPDIVICDIEMPFINGIELASIAKKRQYKTKFILCSMYNKFEYAQQAVNLDCSGYILKPFSRSELHSVISNVITKIQTESRLSIEYGNLRDALYRNRSVLLQNLIKDLLYGLTQDAVDTYDKCRLLNLNIEFHQFRVILLDIDIMEYQNKPLCSRTGELISHTDDIEFKYIVLLQTQKIVNEIINDMDEFISITLDNNCIALLVNETTAVDLKDSNALVNNVLHLIQSRCRAYDIVLTCAASDIGSDLPKINLLYNQCKYILSYKYLFEKNSILISKDVPSASTVTFYDYNALQDQIRAILKSGTHEDIKAYFDMLFQNSSLKISESYFKSFCLFIVLSMYRILEEENTNASKYFSNDIDTFEIITEFTTLADAKTWLTNIAISIFDDLYICSSNNNKLIASTIIKYINCHDIKNLSIEEMSSDLFYSPNYLNYVFKRECNKSIFDYLIMKKIEKAKELLADRKLKLYEITEVLGYSHTSYFASVFKKHTGLTPKEFRMRCMKDDIKNDEGEKQFP